MPEIKNLPSSEFHYHSESIQKALAEKAKKQQSRRRNGRNIGRLITFVNLAFIMLLFFIFIPKLTQKAAHMQWQGYQWTLKNQAFSGKTFIALHVKAGKDSAYAKHPFQVQFFMDGRVLTESALQDILPEKHQECAIRLELPALTGHQLCAIIQFEGKTSELVNAIVKDEL